MISTAFQSYPVDHFISIVQAWVHQAWPITTAHGQRVYESLGMKPHAADPTLFMSHFAVRGEPDAYFTEHEGLINTVRMQIGRPCPPGTEAQNGPVIAQYFNAYCGSVEQAFGPSTLRRRREDDGAIDWILDNNVGISLGPLSHSIILFIDSPTMTQLLREEEENGLTNYNDILEED